MIDEPREIKIVWTCGYGHEHETQDQAAFCIACHQRDRLRDTLVQAWELLDRGTHRGIVIELIANALGVNHLQIDRPFEIEELDE